MQEPIKAPAKESTNLFLQNRYLIIGIVALVCFSASLLIRVEAVSHVLTEVAYALVIAVAISFGIEAASRRELESTVRSELEQHAEKLADINTQLTKTVEAVGHDVYLAVFKRRIPDETLDEIELGILRSDFARTGHTATYHLRVISIPQLGSNMMSVNVWSAYEVRNIAHAARDYDIRIRIDKAGSDALSKYMQVKEVKVNGTRIPIEKLEMEENEKMKRYSFKVRSVPAGNTVEVEGSIEYIKYLDDYEIWTSALASDGMKLTINLPNEVKQWDVFSIHREPIRTITKRTSFGSFALEHAVLPQQGMAIWWRCSNEFAQNATPQDQTFYG